MVERVMCEVVGGAMRSMSDCWAVCCCTLGFSARSSCAVFTFVRMPPKMTEAVLPLMLSMVPTDEVPLMRTVEPVVRAEGEESACGSLSFWRGRGVRRFSDTSLYSFTIALST